MIGSCGVCPAKDEIIADLRRQLAETHKSLLAVTDARAYAMRYPTERPAREVPAPKLADTLDRRRFRLYEPETSNEQVEKLFEADQELERKLRGGA